MPSFSKSVTTITYTPDDVKKLIQTDLHAEGYVVSLDAIELQISGGYVNCDCNSWGGPRVGSCTCPTIPPKFEGYKIIYKE
jgi:hypothetical protein